MNIWIFNHYAVGPNSNGITRHFDLAKNLVAQGHKVTIFASSFNHQALKEEHILEDKKQYLYEEYDGVKYVWIKTIPYKKNNWRRVVNMLSYTIKSYFISRRKEEIPDVVIGSLAHPLAALVGYFTARKKKALFYFEERDLWPQSLIDLGKMSERNPAIKLLSKLEKFLYNKSTRIILLFDKAINYVESRDVTREKVLYLPNGVDYSRLRFLEELPKDIQKDINELEGKTIAVYTGTLGLANNIDVILDSANQLKHINENIHFLLVGGGPEKERLLGRKKYENLDNVTFIDPVPKKHIYSILRFSHIGLLPLQDSPVFKWGISPNKMYDYMSSSLPVLLMCNLEDTPIENQNAGKVIKNDFADGITNFLAKTDKKQLSEMGTNGANYVKENHDWSKLAQKLSNTIKKDLNNAKL